MSQEQPRLTRRTVWLPLSLIVVAVVGVAVALHYGAPSRSVLFFIGVFVAIGAVETGLYEFIRRRFGNSVLIQGLLFLVFTALLLGFAASFW
jgi:uncharacterized membrane protein HdeD (DUF308 family)